MATSPEKKIEAALITAIGALNYFATNSIDVVAHDDMTHEKTDKWVSVECAKAQRLEPNYNYYRSSVEVSSVVHLPNDENDAISENMYDAVNGYVQHTLTAAALTTAVNDSTVTVDGIVPTQNDDDYDDNHRVKIVAFDCFYTYTT